MRYRHALAAAALLVSGARVALGASVTSLSDPVLFLVRHEGEKALPVPAAKGPPPSEVIRIQDRLASIRDRVARENAWFLSEFVYRYGGANPDGDGTRERQALAFAQGFEARQLPLLLEAALLADELDRYKATGTLSPASAEEVERIRRQLEVPWAAIKEDPLEHVSPPPTFSSDLAELQRQLSDYDRSMGRPDRFRPRRETSTDEPARERLSPPPPPTAPAGKPLAEPASLERDAGMGAASYDPVPVLISLLSAERAFERALAAGELGARGGAARDAVPALRCRLSDPDAGVRASAVLALGAVDGGSPDVVRDIERALQDPNPHVRFSARTALSRLGARPEASGAGASQAGQAHPAALTIRP